jgi:hypothetical protein
LVRRLDLLVTNHCERSDGAILATPPQLLAQLLVNALANRSKSHVCARTDRGGRLLPAGETAGRSKRRPLSTSIRLACKVIAATETSRAASVPRMTNSSTGMCNLGPAAGNAVRKTIQLGLN